MAIQPIVRLTPYNHNHHIKRIKRIAARREFACRTP
jgi:hypothetical protein